MPFLIWPLFRGLGRNPDKNFIGFVVDLKAPKCPFEINWTLVRSQFWFTDSHTALLELQVAAANPTPWTAFCHHAKVHFSYYISLEFELIKILFVPNFIGWWTATTAQWPIRTLVNWQKKGFQSVFKLPTPC